jgi:hypothetical protein
VQSMSSSQWWKPIQYWEDAIQERFQHWGIVGVSVGGNFIITIEEGLHRDVGIEAIQFLQWLMDQSVDEFLNRECGASIDSRWYEINSWESDGAMAVSVKGEVKGCEWYCQWEDRSYWSHSIYTGLSREAVEARVMELKLKLKEPQFHCCEDFEDWLDLVD